MTFCPCKSNRDRGARYGAQAGAYLGTKTGSKYGGPFATGFNAGLGAALGYVGGSLLDRAKAEATPDLVPDGGRPVADTGSEDPTDDEATEIPVTEGPLFE